MKGNTILSLIFYIYGAISDSIDGYFARKLNAYTKFGQYLDAIKVIISNVVLNLPTLSVNTFLFFFNIR